MNKDQRKITTLAALGGMLELYDFAIYGTFSIYFSHQFFSSSNHYALILQTYTVFLLGFILRPIGGIIFSHIGDEVGRKRVLVATVFIMGLSSIAIACTPTYKTIGMMAPILLVVFRMLQGVALGGELPTTYVYIKESLPQNKILAFGFVMGGVLGGYLFAALINLIFTYIFTNSQLEEYGWRIPFFIGGVICFVSYKIRKSLSETQAFKNISDKPKIPIVYLLKNCLPQVILGIFLSASQQVFSVVSIIFMPTYLHTILNRESVVVGALLPIGTLVTVLAIIFFGFLLNKVKNLKHLLLFTFLLNILIVPGAYFLMVNTEYLYSGYVLLMLGHGLIALLIPLYLTTLFPSNIALSGVALSYNLSVISFAGTAPIIITLLIKKFSLITLPPVIYILVFMLISGIGILLNKKSYLSTEC